MVKNIKWPLLYISICILCQGFTTPHGGVNGIKTIVIDAGHGGRDPGCMGNVHREKDVSLAVALRLGKFLEDNIKDLKVVYTRTTDVFVDLEDRAQIANKAKADLFISIHCNAAGKPVMVKDPKTGKMRAKMFKNKKGRWVPVETTNPVPYGTETYVMGLKNEAGKMEVATRENSAILLEENYEKKYGGFDPESEESYIIMSNYTSAYVIQSASLGIKIQEEYARKAGRVDKGVHRQSIWVLWRTSMPSVLTEIGFLTNPLEEQFLGSEKGQDYIAKALFRGIRKYKDEVENVKRQYNDEFENQIALTNENLENEKKEKEKEKAEGEREKEKKAPEDSSDLASEDGTPLEVKIKEDEVLEVKEPLKETDTAAGSVLIAEKYKSKVDPIPTNDLFFKVQFASSDVALNLKQGKFSEVIDADFYKDNNILKYTSGKFTSLKDAQTHQGVLRDKGFKDCFIIAVKNGKRIDMAEARKLLGSKP
jgi:N-acetylmuramoyl-L-alanine amidase